MLINLLVIDIIIIIIIMCFFYQTGRVIRHKNDYAVIILLDSRYGNERIKLKLPSWMLPYYREEEIRSGLPLFGPSFASVSRVSEYLC